VKLAPFPPMNSLTIWSIKRTARGTAAPTAGLKPS
jgi:hypothetical protein